MSHRSGLLAAALCVFAALAGCSGGDSGPYIKFVGGGFLFNYRIAEITCGLIAAPARTLPEGSRIEARFENPSGGAPILVTLTPPAGETKYELTTPPLKDVRKDRDYAVQLLVLGPDGKELQKDELKFRSEVDASVMPAAPLTVGPGYQRPDAPPN